MVKPLHIAISASAEHKKGSDWLYERYAKLRDERGVTDYAVAKATGINTATLSCWKSGRYSPKIEKLKKIADFFGVSLDYFVGE